MSVFCHRLILSHLLGVNRDYIQKRYENAIETASLVNERLLEWDRRRHFFVSKLIG